ncbi:abscission/NoCut checkpoint regulator [Hemicordylus capensis]|uniref:abscission/NoCut checkpoint regulator n=1 Tax=Hemicordylus capensis TaxID=884348 RepID=UPI002303686E|nr:abscission/NoCut checkpoint regulator [Hemicordylus capensis]XP_053127398.1 abscission/NoCut checkpoint regulator [Hemicordylus capensis]XP_053127405.1 abscission/NoCut checkpoint regulator [Hemicordylus capensis]
MDSRCYGCASKFTVFKKQCGCKNCGRAFCSSCLGFSVIVPRCGNTQQKVCKRCHGELTSGSPPSNAAKWSPPENYKKRVAAFEAKQNQTQALQKGSMKSPSQTDSRYLGLSKEDQAIAERLERLKKKAKPKSIPSQAEIEARLAALKDDATNPIPSTQEMEDRLAALQGRPLPSTAPRPVHQHSYTRTQVEQSDDLLNQMAEEVGIDESVSSGVSPQEVNTQILNDLNRNDGIANIADLDPKQLDEEKNRLLAEAATELREENTRQEKILVVAKRLAALRGQDPEKVTLDDYKFPNSDEEMEEEEAIQRVLKQLTEEAALDEASGFNISPEQSSQPGTAQQKPAKKTKQAPIPAVVKAPILPTRVSDSDEEELPWCCICNEDATLRCHGCDDDLYCQRCFQEGHDEFDRKEHRTSSYRPPCKQK